MDGKLPKLQDINLQIQEALVNLKQDPYKKNYTSVCLHSSVEKKKKESQLEKKKNHPLHTGGNRKCKN